MHRPNSAFEFAAAPEGEHAHGRLATMQALWVLFVVILPFLGVFVYLIARGHKMDEHTAQAAQAQDAGFRQYVQQAAGPKGQGARLTTIVVRYSARADGGVGSRPTVCARRIASLRELTPSLR